MHGGQRFGAVGGRDLEAPGCVERSAILLSEEPIKRSALFDCRL